MSRLHIEMITGRRGHELMRLANGTCKNFDAEQIYVATRGQEGKEISHQEDRLG